MAITTTKLYQLLSEKVGKETVESLTNFIEEKVEEQFHLHDFATKDFVHAEIEKAKSEIIRWMFVFWIGQVAVTIGIMLLILSVNSNNNEGY